MVDRDTSGGPLKSPICSNRNPHPVRAFTAALLLLSTSVPISSFAFGDAKPTPPRVITTAAESATDIVRKSDRQQRGDSSYVEMTMTITRPAWTRTMSMKSWTKGDDYALVLITAPARDKGSSSLKRKREMWNWIPSIERVIKIAPSMLGQSWMGSDFTNDDLINQSSIVVDYTHRLVREDEVDDAPAWVIEATPKADAPVVWSKVVLWIGKAHYNQRRVQFYDDFGDLISELTTFDVGELGDRILPRRLEMRPADEEGRKTELIYRKAEFDFDVAAEFFSQASMKELRE